ncbi:EpsG family protein [Nitrosomonas sp.]|uniref:EpsG family protein n=1 Tax=Nitrosomonas sp. TaxID=42353 RepID=UPI0025E977DA|nr:EpsG family protein [Nitrosomonas sp.]MCC6917109.1 EpsG family protein [Nitrosomonas sp.]
MKVAISKTALNIIAVLGFAAVMVAIPWEEIFRVINGHGFTDKEVYADYFLNQTSVLDYKEFDGVLSYISNEFLWHYAIGWLVNNTGIQIDYMFSAISFIALLIFGSLLTKWQGIYALPFLINPLVIDFSFSQYRLALAISILGVAYLLHGRHSVISLVLALAALFIHSGTMLFILIYAAVRTVQWLSVRFRIGCSAVFITLFMTGTFVSLLIGPLREVILSAVGDRRAEYHDMSSSTLYSLFWMALLIPFYVSRRHLVALDYARYALVIISIVFVNVFHGGYSTRFLAAAFPCLVSAILSLRGVTKIMTVVLFIAYAMFQWLYWLRMLGG